MATWNPQANDIFLKALEISALSSRRDYLASACGSDSNLRSQVDALISANDIAGSFLESPCAPVATMEVPPIAERPGSVIGPYKLLEQIGEGGMGIVFMAEQTQPIQRKVALKIIKPGMDTRQVIARFEAERQALALMDHPNIARVLDAGSTGEGFGVQGSGLSKQHEGKVQSSRFADRQQDAASASSSLNPEPRTLNPPSGRPYFVMELVRGVPITDHCDNHRLSIRERLELFITICQAVQHAHQKGIIHRDLKPTNVLVTLHDGKPVVKVIDFGVAKATGQKLTEKTLFTGFAQLVGTPLYMSPEQAEPSGLDVDTRSDIYSLGVLLYELLTGQTPFESQRLKEAAFDEMRRIIREEDPPRPSTRLSTLAQQAISTVSEKRASDPRQLSRLFQGELDWIVMKSLDKDRNRRYETASALGADVEHYLHDEPVQACPPSAAYRFRKFMRRNKWALATGGLVAAALFLGTLISTWQAIRATHAEQQAKSNEQQATANAKQAEEVAKFLAGVFRSSDPHRGGNTINVMEFLDRSAKELQDQFPDDPRTKAALLYAVGEAYNNLGMFHKAIPLLEDARNLRTQTLGPDHRDTLSAMQLLGKMYGKAGRISEALVLTEETLQRRKSVLGPNDADTLKSMDSLATMLVVTNRIAEGTQLAEKTLKLQKANLGPDHPDTLATMVDLGFCYSRAGRNPESLALAEELVKLDKLKLGPNASGTLLAMYNLSTSYRTAGRPKDALPVIEECVRIAKTKPGPEHPDTLRAQSELAAVYENLGRLDEALALINETIDLQRLHSDPGSRDILISKRHRSAILAHRGADLAMEARRQGGNANWDAAAAEFLKALDDSEDERYHSDRILLCNVLAEWDEVFDRVVRARPSDTAIRLGRAEGRALRSRWADALPDYEKVIHQRPTSGDEISEYAYLLVLQNDIEGYQRFCRELLDRQGGPQNGIEAMQMARAFAAGPSEVVDSQRLVDWATQAVAYSPSSWCLHILGLAQYRAAHYEQAIESLHKSNATSWEPGVVKAQNWLVLAMAHHRLEHSAEAQQCLATARKLIDKARPTELGKPTYVPLPDWIPMQVLLREAEALLQGGDVKYPDEKKNQTEEENAE